MFWSLVRPDRILQQITRSAAVTTSLEAGELAVGMITCGGRTTVKRCDGSLRRRLSWGMLLQAARRRCVPARTAHSQAALTFVMRPTTAHRLTPAHPAWRPRAVNAL